MLTKLKMMRDSAKCLLVVIAVMLLASLGAVVMAADAPPDGPFGVVPGDGGSVMELHTAAGGCIGSARLAIWFSYDRKERVPGCWKTVGGSVQIAFADGDVAMIPMSAVKRPETL